MQIKIKSNNSKSQAFSTDFVISILILIVIFIIYVDYTKNLSSQDSESLDELLADARTISSSLISSGSPNNWNADKVGRIGFTDDGNVINNAKFDEFLKINYNVSKKLLGTINEYFLFFENESRDVQNVEGICGVGNLNVVAGFALKSAYYYKDETKLKQFMIDKFDADLYDINALTKKQIEDTFDNFDNYDLIVIESPEFDTDLFGDLKNSVEPWVEDGGIFMLSARPVAAQNRQMLGVKFNKQTGDHTSNEPATVQLNDPFIAFTTGQVITFAQVYYITDQTNGPANFFPIATFNFDTDKIALARWEYGGGKTLFFSDFDASLLAGNFQQQLEQTVKKWVHPECLPTNLTAVKRDRLVRTDRLLVYNFDGFKIVKMVLLVWN